MNPLQADFFRDVADATQVLEALEHLPGALFMIKNLDSRYIYMSRALKVAINLPPEHEVAGKTDFDLFPKIIAESFRQNDLLVFEHGMTLVNEVHATGFFAAAPKWTFSSKYPLHNRAGKVVGLITINRPYSEVMGRDAELNRLLPAIEHVFRHYADAIPIGTLARLCSLSESQFMRVFRQGMKMTAQGFVEQVRMFHAIDAIKHTAHSIARIAQETGFYDHSAFVKRFRKFTGTTPLNYRRKQQANLKTDRAIAVPMVGESRRS
jgi:AraC-like DNA-binding protein